MKDFEKFLTDLPKPAVEVPEFRERLRREITSMDAARNALRRRPSFGLGGAVAACLALLLIGFVVWPEIPGALHGAVTGTLLQAEQAGAAVPTATTAVDADREFVESWVRQQEQPVNVRSIESEKVFSVRQFELTDGKRMLVFTEFGGRSEEPFIMNATTTTRPY